VIIVRRPIRDERGRDMYIKEITAAKDSIVIKYDGDNRSSVYVREKVPTIGLSSRENAFIKAESVDNTITIPRFDGSHDRIWSEFEIWHDSKKAEGIKYVTEFDNVAKYDYPYPQPESIQAAGGTDEDIKFFGTRQNLLNVSLTAIMTPYKGDDTITYVCDGKEYYFIKSEIDNIDNTMRRAKRLNLLMTFILLKSPKHFGSKRDPLLLSKVIHPNFDWNDPHAFISSFNMVTEDGQNYYKAFTEFLAERYTNPNSEFGLLGGMIIGNEVDSQYVWGNSGEMTVEDYTLEYTQAMRIAWISARKHYANFRVYVSLDHYWHGLTHNVTMPLRYYDGKSVIDNINKHAKRDGNFDWNVAHHPYPEDLRFPDFYNDRSPEFHFLTRRITFKNIEVLPAYLSQEELLYKGKPRRIILSEQGFNSRGDAISEEQAAAAYCLAYLKITNIPTIDLFTHHAYVDNKYEFGLNLGIRRRNEDGSMGEPKPIYYTIVDLNDETKREERIAKSRAFIGEKLFDSLLNPEVIHGGPILKGNEGFGEPIKKDEKKTYAGM